MRPIVINGKFYGAGLNGVHRVADRLIREVDHLLAAERAGDRPEVTLYAPSSSTWLPSLAAIDTKTEARATSQVWEQAVLPMRARGAVLVNLCNLAPVLHFRKLMLIHDAQFLFADSSYPARQRLGYRLLVPWMARTSERVLTVSDYSRQILDLTKVSPRSKTALLPNGADHMLEAPPLPGVAAGLGLSPQGYVVMFGSPKRYKNVEIVFRAFEDPRLAGLRLVIVGTERQALEAAGLRPPAGCVFAGRVADDALRSLYGEALCIAFPSRTEGFGLPPIEAATCGCPAVVSPAGAIPEVCRDTVLYAGVDAPEEWADAILAYAAAPSLRAAKLEAARRRAEMFRWKRAGRTLLNHMLALAA